MNISFITTNSKKGQPLLAGPFSTGIVELPVCSFHSLADATQGINRSHTLGRIRRQSHGEVNLVASPTRNQAFGIRNARWRVLNHVTLDTAVIPVPVRRVATPRKVNRDHTVAPENISSERCRARGLIVRGLGDQVRLKEIHAGSRKFENFREVNGRQFFHSHQTF
jgi:hypothetical protein